MDGGAETIGRRGYAGGRGLYRGTLVSRRSVRFVACAYCRRDPCAIENVRSSAHCAPKLDTHTRRLPLGFAQGKRKCASCLWFPEVRASTTHGPHVRSPPPFSYAAALSCSCGYPAYPTIRRKRADQSGCCLAALCELHLAVCGCFWSLIEI